MEPATAFANASFDPVVFKNTEYGRNALEMRKISVDHEQDPMAPALLDYWRAHGAKKELYEAGTPGEYSVFTPLELDLSKKYPVIYVSHGGGDTPLIAESYGYNLFVAQAKVICVYPQNGNQGNGQIETEFPRILNALERDGYPIDRTRVYAVGFSAGSVASLRLALAYPDQLAGVGSVPGPNSFRGGKLAKYLMEYAETSGLRVPLICVGGMDDGGDTWPLEEDSYFNSFNLWMQTVGKAVDYTPMTADRSQELWKNSTDSVKRMFGLDFDKTWIEFFEGTFWYCGQYHGEGGVPVARFEIAEGLPHIHCKTVSREIYMFLRRFSRNLETGELIATDMNINQATKS